MGNKLKRKSKKQVDEKVQDALAKQNELLSHSYRTDQEVTISGREMIMLVTYAKKAFDDLHEEIVSVDGSGRVVGYKQPPSQVLDNYQVVMSIHNRQHEAGNTVPMETLREEYEAEMEKLKKQKEGEGGAPVADASIIVEADGKQVEITPETTEDTIAVVDVPSEAPSEAPSAEAEESDNVVQLKPEEQTEQTTA